MNSSSDSSKSNVFRFKPKDSMSDLSSLSEPIIETFLNPWYNPNIQQSTSQHHGLKEENEMDVNLLIKDFKDELRERDARTEQRQRDLEERLSKQEERYLTDSKEREERYLADAREREERYIHLADEIKQSAADMKNSNEDTVKSVRQNTIATYIGIGAMVVTVVAALVALAVSILPLIK